MWRDGDTVTLPVLVRGVAEMSCTFAIKLGHERAVRVSDQQDGWVIHLDVALAALVRLHADGAATFPVILLALEAWTEGGRFEMWCQKDVGGSQSHVSIQTHTVSSNLSNGASPSHTRLMMSGQRWIWASVWLSVSVKSSAPCFTQGLITFLITYLFHGYCIISIILKVFIFSISCFSLSRI